MDRAMHSEHGHRKSVLFALASAIVLVAGYAASTRFDPVSGRPEAPLEALQPKQDQPAPPEQAVARRTEASAAKQVDPLTETVGVLVAEERSLSAHTYADPASESNAQVSAVPAGEMPALVPPAAPRSRDVVHEATAKVTAADALLRDGGYQRGGARPAAVSPAHQQRTERISQLRSQLADLSTGASNPVVVPPSPGQQ